MAETVDRGVGHISLYILELHEGTPLATAVAAGQVTLPTDSQIESCYLAAVEALARLGLRQYEVANFARPGQESRHNRHYWGRVPYLGLGPGAHGFWGRRRYANEPRVTQYLAAVAAGRMPEVQSDLLTVDARRLERLILPLRTKAGLPLGRIPAGCLPLDEGVAAGLWQLVGGRLQLTAKGFLRIDHLESILARAVSG
jgi:oxygen-independent coproporphyrinogen-3 oxidase